MAKKTWKITKKNIFSQISEFFFFIFLAKFVSYGPNYPVKPPKNEVKGFWKIDLILINPLAAGKIDLRLLQFAQKIVQMVLLT